MKLVRRRVTKVSKKQSPEHVSLTAISLKINQTIFVGVGHFTADVWAHFLFALINLDDFTFTTWKTQRRWWTPNRKRKQNNLLYYRIMLKINKCVDYYNSKSVTVSHVFCFIFALGVSSTPVVQGLCKHLTRTWPDFSFRQKQKISKSKPWICCVVLYSLSFKCAWLVCLSSFSSKMFLFFCLTQNKTNQ